LTPLPARARRFAIEGVRASASIMVVLALVLVVFPAIVAAAALASIPG
jgi:hypothetical protein